MKKKSLIKPIQSIQEAMPLLRNLDDKAIVLFDIDGVLTIPAEPCLHPAIFKKYESCINSVTNRFNREERHIFHHLIVGRTSKLIENGFVDALNDFRSKKIKTFGFTSSSPGIIHPTLPSFHLVREKYLQELNIHFSAEQFQNIDFLELNPTKGEYPGVRNGIIYSCGLNNSKGSVLKRFLSSYPSISTVVFFDDQMTNLDSVREILRVDFPKIQFIGFHYQGMEKLECIDPGEDQVRKYVESLVKLIDNTISNDANYIVIGPCGSGKSSAMEFFKDSGFTALSASDMLRSAMEGDSPTAALIRHCGNTAEAIPDEIVFSIIEPALEAHLDRGFVMESFPYNLAQWFFLKDWLSSLGNRAKKIVFIYLKTDPDTVILRLQGRLTCSKCYRTFHTIYKPPEKPGICDFCHSDLFSRPQDTPGIIRKRLKRFEEETVPVLDAIQKDNYYLLTIDGNRLWNAETFCQELQKSKGS